MQRLYALAHPSYLANSPIMRLYLRLLGAKVGSGVMIAHAQFGAADLVKIGAGASIGHKANIANAEVIAGELIIGEVVIGADSYIGNQVMVPAGCRIGHDARIEDMSAIPFGVQVKPLEIWDGSPAKKVGVIDPAHYPSVRCRGPSGRISNTGCTAC